MLSMQSRMSFSNYKDCQNKKIDYNEQHFISKQNQIKARTVDQNACKGD